MNEMILPLQKRHRLIWTVLAIVLPIGFVSAYLAIQETPVNKATEEIQVFGEVSSQLSDDYFNIIERKDERTDSTIYHLIVEVLQPIRQSSSVLYISETEKVEDGRAIGLVNQQGKYVFNLQDAMQTNDKILFYNSIDKKVFHTLQHQLSE